MFIRLYYLVLIVSLAQCGLEPGVRVHQAGDLLDGVHYEHIHQIFAGAVQPVYNKRILHFTIIYRKQK